MSIVNLGSLSKPADTLIKKVSSVIGGIFKPWQIKRVAKAEAEASLIKAKSEIEITDLHRRAMHRFVEEEANRQENMEQITEKAIHQLDSNSNPDNIEDDWIINFFDKARIISDTDMQNLWARVLAGESNKPGSYSKLTVNILSYLAKRDAELFVSLCRFGWVIGRFTPLIFDEQASIYNDLGISFSSLSHLDSIGLIQYSSLGGFSRKGYPKTLKISYFGQPMTLTMEKESNNKLSIGKVLLTQVGSELASVCQVQVVEGFYDYVKEKWEKYIP